MTGPDAMGFWPIVPVPPSPFRGLELGSYRVIVADPPWSFDDRGTRLAPSYAGPQRAGGPHYATLDFDAIGALPVAELADAAGAWLVLWVPWALVPIGLETIRTWGFEYVTGGEWVKVRTRRQTAHAALEERLESGRYRLARAELHMLISEYDNLARRVRIGGGHHFRAASEPFLLARRGRAYPRARDRSIPNVLFAPRGRHSQKPEQLQDRLERLWPGPYCELFARRERPNWDIWGDELEPREEDTE